MNALLEGLRSLSHHPTYGEARGLGLLTGLEFVHDQATRRLPEGMAAMQQGTWEGWSPTAFLGRRIGGKHLGILGMGRIGQAVARRAAAFGMQVHYHNRKRLRPEIEDELDAT